MKIRGRTSRRVQLTAPLRLHVESLVSFQQRVVEFADDAAGLDGDLQLAVDGLLLRVDEEREAVRLLREVAEADDERRRERPGAVVDLEAVEV